MATQERLTSRPFLALCLIAVLILVVYQTATISRERALADLQSRTAADLGRYSLSLQQELDRYKDIPKLISTHSELLNPLLHPGGDAEARASLYLEKVNETIGASDAYLMNSEGMTVAASNWDKEKTFVGRNFAFRPYFKDGISGQAGRYFALGTTSKKRGYFFSYPVHYRGKTLGVIIVKIDINDIENDWNDPLTDILVTDEDGVIFLSTRPEWKFRTLTPLSQDDLQRILSSLRYGEESLEALNVIKRKDRGDGTELVTLVDGDWASSESLDGVKTRQYLQQTRQVEDAGFNVSILANIKAVERQVFTNVLLASFSYGALVFLLLFLFTRRRVAEQREQFKRQEQQALESSEARVRAIIDNTHAGLITLDHLGRIESFNPTAEKLFGYPAEDVQGKYFSHLLAQQDRAVCWQHITTSTDDDTELMIEALGCREDNTQIPVELVIGRMIREGDRYFIVTVHDMTERKQYEQKLRKARDMLEHRVDERTEDLSRANARLLTEMEQHKHTQNELIQAAKLAVLGQMSAGINHELNQPLTAIRSYADNARSFLDINKPEPAQENLGEISLLTERMAKIIGPLKEFSRKTTGQLSPISLQAAKDGAMAIMYGQLAKAQVDIVWPENAAEVYMLGDMLRLEQVLVNLISNAMQAMDALSSPRIEISASQQNTMMSIAVRDFGPGVPERDLEKVFEPFYTTKLDKQGLGLGLSISHRIILSMGGQLTVTNHPDGGAVFTVLLPVVPSSVQA